MGRRRGPGVRLSLPSPRRGGVHAGRQRCVVFGEAWHLVLAVGGVLAPFLAVDRGESPRQTRRSTGVGCANTRGRMDHGGRAVSYMTVISRRGLSGKFLGQLGRLNVHMAIFAPRFPHRLNVKMQRRFALFGQLGHAYVSQSGSPSTHGIAIASPKGHPARTDMLLTGPRAQRLRRAEFMGPWRDSRSR